MDGGKRMESIKLTVTIEGTSEDFDLNLYARNIAFRALNWGNRVEVTGEDVQVTMENE